MNLHLLSFCIVLFFPRYFSEKKSLIILLDMARQKKKKVSVANGHFLFRICKVSYLLEVENIIPCLLNNYLGEWVAVLCCPVLSHSVLSYPSSDSGH